jgi:hypothetical protein
VCAFCDPKSIKTPKYHAKKKTTIYQETEENKRNEYLKIIEELDKSELVYVDESGIDKFIYREYGCSVR